MLKLVAIDLDGTLLDSYGNVSERAKSVIKKIKEDGTKVIIASGRPMNSINTIAKEIGTDKFFIAGNGAIIYDMEEEKIIYGNFIPKEKVIEIVELCEKNSISYNIYTEKKIIAKSLKYNVLYYYKENQKKEINKKTEIVVENNILEYINNLNDENFLKITICDENSIVFKSILKKLKKIEGVEVLEVSHMSRKVIKQGTEYIPIEYNYTEISAQNVDKWNAIEYLAKELEIKKEEIMAIGDNINDKLMIKNAGVGISMKHSTPEITKISNYVTETNDDEGVALALEKYFL